MDSAVPTVRSFSADFEPLRLLAQLPETYPALLESSSLLGTVTSCAPTVSSTTGNATAGAGRFDILPMSSGECLRLDGHRRLSGPHSAGADGFLSALEHWWLALRSPGHAAPVPVPLPFTGGWFLYLGYELSAEIESSLRLPPSPDSVTALAIRAPAAWIRDRASGQAWLVAEPGSETLLDAFEDHVRQATLTPSRSPAPGSPSAGTIHGGRFVIHEEEPDRFLTAVSRSLEYIAAGDVYQTNLSRQWQARSERPLDALSIYERLRSANPSPFAALMQYGGFSVMSSSPERLLSIRGNIVATRPIAGTRPRGKSREADAALIESLRSNAKERAEHVMLIDLERNDLGRVCVAGSVEVDEYMSVETYAHVHHIVSNVSGRLRDEVSPIQVIRALFPGGTITGCPKVRCMEIIAELEGTGRGAYTGSIGYLNRDGSCDLNILIRTLTAETGSRSTQPTDLAAPGVATADIAPPRAAAPGVGTLTFRAGAGIVADSNPLQELAETRAKAKGMLRALEALS